jgi:peptidoglycan hydrolase CwlO-like protein
MYWPDLRPLDPRPRCHLGGLTLTLKPTRTIRSATQLCRFDGIARGTNLALGAASSPLPFFGVQMKSHLPALTLLTLSLLASVAHAGTVSSSGDWQLDDSIPGDGGRGSCQASTAGYLGSTVVSLALVVDKSGARPLELMLIPNKPVPSTALYAQSSSGATYYFAKLANGQYWNIPTNTDRFVADLKNGNQLTFFSVAGSAEQLPLSLSGSTATIAALQARCTKGGSLYTARAFEQAFLPNGFDRFNIKAITPAKAASLRALVASAIPAYLKLRGIQAELATLNAKNQSLINERAQLTTDLANLRGVVVPNLTAQRDAAQVKIDKATAEIASLNDQIAAAQVQLATAQSVAANALALLTPLIPEHNRLLGLRQNDERRLDAARSSLANIDNSISTDQQAIQSLNSETNQLNANLPGAQNEVQNGQNGLAQANAFYQGYDPRRVAEERFHRDPQAQQLNEQIRQLEGQINAYAGQVQSASGAVQAYQSMYNQAVGQLNQCRSGHASLDVLRGRFLADGPMGGRGGFGGGQGGPGMGGPGAPPSPAPAPALAPIPAPPQAPNCSAQEGSVNNAQAQLNNAVAQLNNAQNGLNNAQAQSSQAQQQMNQIRQGIEYQVSNEQRELADRVSQWQQYLSQAQNNLSNIQNRLDNILRYDLPHAQNDLANNEARRPGAVTEVAASEGALANSTAAFNAYEAAVNFDAIKAEADRTANVVSQIKATIAAYQQGVSARNALIAQQTNLRDSLNTRIASNNALIAQKQARLDVINTALAAYDVQKAEIQGRIDAAAAALKVISDQYADALK